MKKNIKLLFLILLAFGCGNFYENENSIAWSDDEKVSTDSIVYQQTLFDNSFFLKFQKDSSNKVSFLEILNMAKDTLPFTFLNDGIYNTVKDSTTEKISYDFANQSYVIYTHSSYGTLLIIRHDYIIQENFTLLEHPDIEKDSLKMITDRCSTEYQNSLKSMFPVEIKE
jgi:hypothetical protein